ncbi:ABC transporter permease [Natribaculum luteum]|uniref:ABC transporter permease n=1 Tax=Natribaculum luteum TaxID=1586232 RepID=A0ABD5P0H5_9EURY|nr:ABC transporter permease [Natribaculum luteum]
MKTDNSSATADAFSATAEYEQTTFEVYQEQVDAWVIAPLRILWNDYRGRFGIVVVTLYVLMGTVGVTLVPEPAPNMAPRLIQPFTAPEHILGTDGMGQDLLSLMVHSTPDMLKMILAGAVFGTFLSTTIGLYTGYVGGTTDKLVMTFVDTLNSIPGVPLLIVLAAVLVPKNPFLVGIILNIQGFTGGVRTLRSQVIPLAEEEHIEVARALGKSKSELLVKELLPHLLPYIFIGFLGGATRIVFSSVALYFLGILPFSTQNWGVVLHFAYEQGSIYSSQYIHWLLVPMVTIVGLTLGLTMLAQAFDQVFNPRVRARHKARNAGRSTEGEQETAEVATTQSEMGMR